MAAVFGSLPLGGSYLFSCAMSMVWLDSELMDLEEEDIENAGYYRPLQGIDLHTFENDDECEEKCRLPKHAIKQLLMSLPVGEYVQMYYSTTNRVICITSSRPKNLLYICYEKCPQGGLTRIYQTWNLVVILSDREPVTIGLSSCLIRILPLLLVQMPFTNCKVCCYEGSTMTGERGFCHAPPTLQEYLEMM
jgi:hypothetical protein